MRHGWTVLSEKDKGPIFVHFRAMCITWFVRWLHDGTFPDVDVSILILVTTFPEWLSGTEPLPHKPGTVRPSLLCL